MADPNPKRVKMDNPIGECSSSNDRITGKIFNRKTQSFNMIRNMPAFVDHTHFIRGFLLEEQALAIFAPRRFGKSSHLNMVLQFLQIDMDETTRKGPAKSRQNYKLFESTRIITDDENKKLVEDHLGRHPVIHLDFKGRGIESFELAEKHCRNVVRTAYLNHSYLITSTKLVPDDAEENTEAQKVCKNWCSYKTCNEDEEFKKLSLVNSLKNLATFLYNHFDKAKVYILVDEVDALNASALHDLKEPDANTKIEKLQKIGVMFANLLGEVAKGCDDLVAGVLLTGISYASGIGYSSLLNNVTTMKFLDGKKLLRRDREFVPFYGGTRDEVERLIQKLVKNKNLVDFEEKKEFLNEINELDAKKIMADVQSRYNGYFDVNGKQIFCLWSVLSYLETGVSENYWNQTDGIQNLYKILRCEDVLSEFIKLVKGETIEFERLDTIRIHELVALDDLITDKSYKVTNYDIIYNFLMDQGYLTYAEEGAPNAQIRKFKIPNAEVANALNRMIRDIVNENWHIHTQNCGELIDDISLSLMKDEEALQEKMLEVYQKLCLIFQSFGKMEHALLNKTKILCIIFSVLYDAKSFVLTVDLPIKDEGKILTLDRPDFLMMHSDENSSILWELKCNKSKDDKYTTSLYALQEARGILPTTNGQTKSYMDTLKKLGREVLIIGLSVDSDLKVSLSYALGMEEKIFFKSEWESRSPEFYKCDNIVDMSLPVQEEVR